MRILILGGGGQLGSCFRELEFDGDVYDRSLDVLDIELLRDRLVGYDCVINLASWTDVGLCGIEGYRINVVGARNVWLVCRELGIFSVGISSDYVFSGGVCSELDGVSPINFYGMTKYWGEFGDLVIRTSWLFSRYGGFPWRLFGRVGEVGMSDGICSPTNGHDLAGELLRMVRDGVVGLVHLAGPVVDRYEFAGSVYRELGDLGHVVPRLIRVEDIGVRRPRVGLDSGLARGMGYEVGGGLGGIFEEGEFVKGLSCI